MARAPAEVGALAASVLQAAKGGRSPHAVLQLPAAATREEAKLAFKRLRISLHPDRVHEQRLEGLAAEAFQAVCSAFEQLQQVWERRGSEIQPSQPEQPPGGGINHWSAFTAGHAPARQQAPAQQPERPAGGRHPLVQASHGAAAEGAAGGGARPGAAGQAYCRG